MSSQKEIYFHVGLGKAASTYLQYKVFPQLKGITYIQRTKYHHFEKAISNCRSNRILISREFDRQLEDEVVKFSKIYPNATPIIIFRRHDGWIASQYRRYVKNGGIETFEHFVDVKKDSGLWKLKHLTFFPMIEMLEKHFSHKPIVLFHEDLKSDQFGFIDALANAIGAHYNREDISLRAFHKSYNEKQLKVIRKISPRFFTQNRKPLKSAVLRWLRRRWNFLKSYAILYFALLIPNKYVAGEDLIPKESLNEIRAYFKEDWEKCRIYTQRNDK